MGNNDDKFKRTKFVDINIEEEMKGMRNLTQPVRYREK